MVLKSDKQAIQAAIKTCNRLDKENVTVIRIKNTNELKEIQVSENLVGKIKDNPYLKIISAPYELSFNSAGNLF